MLGLCWREPCFQHKGGHLKVRERMRGEVRAASFHTHRYSHDQTETDDGWMDALRSTAMGDHRIRI